MTEPRALLDAYAVGHEAGAIGCRGFNRRDHAPAAFAALRAVLNVGALLVARGLNNAEARKAGDTPRSPRVDG